MYRFTKEIFRKLSRETCGLAFLGKAPRESVFIVRIVVQCDLLPAGLLPDFIKFRNQAART